MRFRKEGSRMNPAAWASRRKRRRTENSEGWCPPKTDAPINLSALPDLGKAHLTDAGDMNG